MLTELSANRTMDLTYFLIKYYLVKLLNHHAWLECAQIAATVGTRALAHLRGQVREGLREVLCNIQLQPTRLTLTAVDRMKSNEQSTITKLELD